MAYIGKKKIRALENGGALVIFGMKRPPRPAMSAEEMADQ